jgi:hypothetical protein
VLSALLEARIGQRQFEKRIQLQKMKKVLLIFTAGLFVISCNPNQKKGKEAPSENTILLPQRTAASGIFGNYADDSYPRREEGYDWVAVSVKEGADNAISISVRSRADKKSPTCTFDTKAYKKDDVTFGSIYNGTEITYTFSERSITISTETEEDENVLYFFCSGGATLAGTYSKIDGPLDPEQVDKTAFSKVLNLQGVGFNVSSIEQNGTHTLTVFTYGLEERDYRETFDITGYQITDAEVEDLNSDGSPELLIYTQSDGSGSYGNVLAFSVNNKKSMSQVYVPPVADNEKINKGYMGHDEFSVVETSLVQRFPIYKEGDTNANPTGGIRQISYKLVEGEAMRKLEVDKITDY